MCLPPNVFAAAILIGLWGQRAEGNQRGSKGREGSQRKVDREQRQSDLEVCANVT